MSAPPAQTGRLAYASTSAPPPTSIPPAAAQAPSHMTESKGTPPMGFPTSEPPKAPAINTTELLQGLTSLGILQGGNAVSTPPMAQESVSTPTPPPPFAGIRLESKDLQMCVLLEHEKMEHRTEYYKLCFHSWQCSTRCSGSALLGTTTSMQTMWLPIPKNRTRAIQDGCTFRFPFPTESKNEGTCQAWIIKIMVRDRR